MADTVSDRPNSSVLDVEAVRRDFPILSETVYGKPLVFMDSGASAQKPRQVIERVQFFILMMEIFGRWLIQPSLLIM